MSNVNARGPAWVYFKGTDVANPPLWKIKDDGTGLYHIGEGQPDGPQSTGGTPFVVSDPKGGPAWVYFHGTGPFGIGKLWKIKDDGTGLYHIGSGDGKQGQLTNCSPFVVPDPKGGPAWVYFVQSGVYGTLCKIKDDGTGLYHIGTGEGKSGAQYAASTPFVIPDPNGGPAWVYYQGTDTTLWKIRDDGTGLYHIGTGEGKAGPQYTNAVPFVVADPHGGPATVYYKGSDVLNPPLWKIRDDGTGLYAIGYGQRDGVQFTAATPFVVPDPAGGPATVYFKGTDVANPALWKIKDDGTDLVRIGAGTPAGPQSTGATPFVVPDPDGGPATVYYPGTEAANPPLWTIRDDGTRLYRIGYGQKAGPQSTDATPFVVR